MAVEYNSTDGVSNSGVVNSASSVSFNHTISGTDVMLAVGVASDDNTAADRTVTVASSNWNGSETFSSVNAVDSSFGGRATGLYRAAPTSGTHAVLITMGGTCDLIYAWALTLTGVDQSSPLDANATATGSGADPRVSISITTNTANSLILDFTQGQHTAGDTVWNVGAGQTSLVRVVNDGSVSDNGAYCSYEPTTTTGSYTITWTGGSSRVASGVAGAFKPSSTTGMEVAVGNLLINTGVVGTTYSVTGLFFQPKALLLFWNSNNSSTDNITEASLNDGYGIVASTTQRYCAFTASEQGQATSDANCMVRNDACVGTFTSSGTISVDGLADFQSFNADGFTLVVDDAFATAVRVHYIAIGGPDVTNVFAGDFSEPAATGNFQETGVGFQPDVTFFLSAHSQSAVINATFGSSGSEVGLCLGAAVSSSEQCVLAGRQRGVTANAASWSYINDAECLARLTNSAVEARFSFVSHDADGFTLNAVERNVTTADYPYLCIKGGQWHVGNISTRTDTTNESETGVGFQPKGLLMLSANRAESTIDTSTTVYERSIGAVTSASSRWALGSRMKTGVTTDCAGAVEYDEMYINIDNSATMAVEGLMDIVSIDSDGFTFVMDDADPSASFVPYVAMGSAAAAASAPSIDFAGTWNPQLLSLGVG